ncbi:universal stress protein [Paenibacillus glycinis]|uniref:Universal stress protein n=1 Tax=Paenibacillus glycinis TaxID=2697035 RepID=A0ABW9XZ36_9BACL|nr:universal stress protein [Paenibacillus glycinis]
MTYTEILVAYDGSKQSDNALEQAMLLARDKPLHNSILLELL